MPNATAKTLISAVISSFNRNFAGRQDGNTSTHSFVASPEIATAMAFAGSLTFNPVTDSLPLPNGGSFKFSEPSGLAFPQEAYERSLDFYSGPVEDGSAVEVDVDASSERIQLLRPFPAWNGEDSQDLTTLIKVQGKCTTDHISPAGPWYRYRGHLENISVSPLCYLAQTPDVQTDIS
jgi:aconitate hydratase